MLKLLQKVRDAIRSSYDPNPHRRAEVIRFLAERPSRFHDEWHRDFAAARGIPLSFVAWYLDTCSKYFGYDLSAALPDDRLVEDLGFSDATWSDADWDILEDYEAQFGCKSPPLEHVTTFGQFLEALWTHFVSLSRSANAR
jgi:AcrR family transcriptional regulator